jgi:hypothetical protein
MELFRIAKMFIKSFVRYQEKGWSVPFHSRNCKGCLHLRKTLFREEKQLSEDVNAWLRIRDIFIEHW